MAVFLAHVTGNYRGQHYCLWVYSTSSGHIILARHWDHCCCGGNEDSFRGVFGGFSRFGENRCFPRREEMYFDAAMQINGVSMRMLRVCIETFATNASWWIDFDGQRGIAGLH